MPEASGPTLAAAADLGLADATTLQVTDQLTSAGLTDFYQFHVAGSSTAIIYAAGLTTSATVTLYHQYGTVLASCTGGLDGDAWLSQDLPILPPGSSYAVIVASSRATPYSFSILAQAYAMTAASQATATALGPLSAAPVTASGTLRPLEPQQYFAFTLTSPATVDVALTASGSAQVQLNTAGLAPIGSAAYQAAGPGTVLVSD